VDKLKKLNLIQEVQVDSFKDKRGELNIFEFKKNIYFEVKRFYYISKVPKNESRGAHAHKNLKQIFFALSGFFTLNVTDGKFFENVIVEANSSGYFIPEGMWRSLTDFSPNAICLVLASEYYTSSDYINTFDEYLGFINANN
jgi:hypothetical protein